MVYSGLAMIILVVIYSLHAAWGYYHYNGLFIKKDAFRERLYLRMCWGCYHYNGLIIKKDAFREMQYLCAMFVNAGPI